MNYTTQEYANDVVFARAWRSATPAGVPHPTIVTESGRAVVAHHSVLVVDVLGVSEFDVGKVPEKVGRRTPHRVVQQPVRDLPGRHAQEPARDLPRRARVQGRGLHAVQPRPPLAASSACVAENLFWAICQKILRIVRELREVPEELEGLEKHAVGHLLLQLLGVPVAARLWAIDQLFPIMPIHRLNEEPTRRAVLADITCDSDGKIDHFIDLRDVKDVLELHPLNGDDYYLGIFLVGAYQEILGDLHNLFGDTNAVHVSLAPDGGYLIEHVVAGDTVTEVLQLRQLLARTTWWRRCAGSPSWRCAPSDDASTSRGRCCACTRKAWPATRTSNGRRDVGVVGRGRRGRYGEGSRWSSSPPGRVRVGACADIQVRLIGPQLPARPAGCALEVFPGGKPPFIVDRRRVGQRQLLGHARQVRRRAAQAGVRRRRRYDLRLLGELGAGFTHIDAKFAIRVR